MATKKTLPTVELRTPGRPKPERCPDAFCAVASDAAISYWGDDKTIARKRGDRAIETVATAPKGAEFISVSTSPDGERFSVARSTDSGWQRTVFEPDGAQRELTDAYVIALCDDGRAWIADNKRIQCIDRSGAAIGPERATGGYIPAHIRDDGHAALPAWSGVEVIDPTGVHIKIAAGTGPTKAVVLHPTLPLVAAQFEEERALRVIDWQKKEVLFEHSAPWCRGVTSLAFSPDGTKLAAVGAGLLVLDLLSGATVFSIPGSDSATGAFTAQGTLLACRSRVLAAHVMGESSSPLGPIFALRLSRDGSKLAFTRDLQAYVMDARTGEERAALTEELAKSTRANDVAILGDDTLVVRGSGYLLFVDIATRAVRSQIEAEDTAYIAVSPEHTELALAGNSLEILDPSTGARRTLATDANGFGALRWTRSGISARRLGRNSTGPVEVYSADHKSGDKPAVCALPKSYSGYAECSFASGAFVVIGASGAVLIGPVSKEKSASKAALKGVEGPVACSSDGRRFAVVHQRAAEGGTVYELDDSGAPVAIARFDAEDAQCLALSHDGRTLAVGANTNCLLGAIDPS